MSTQRRLFFGPLAGFVIVMLLAGMLYAPTALANAASDNGKGKGKSDSNTNGNHNTNTNGNHNSETNGNNGNQNNNNNGEKDNGKGNGNGGEKDDDNKCKKHKYDGQCDKKKPEVEIDTPENHGKVGSSITVKGKASDSGSGIHDVQVNVDGKSFTTVSNHSGDWTFTTSGLHTGQHTITAKATDNSHNMARAHVSIKVT